jgi:hypothetical protein
LTEAVDRSRLISLRIEAGHELEAPARAHLLDRQL